MSDTLDIPRSAARRGPADDSQRQVSVERYCQILDALRIFDNEFSKEFGLGDLLDIAKGHSCRFHGGKAHEKITMAASFLLMKGDASAVVPFDDETADILVDMLREKVERRETIVEIFQRYPNELIGR